MNSQSISKPYFQPLLCLGLLQFNLKSAQMSICTLYKVQFEFVYRKSGNFHVEIIHVVNIQC